MSTSNLQSTPVPPRHTRPGMAARLRRRLRRAVRTQRVFVAPPPKVRMEPPIFIIGVHRSGTTLLRLVLDSHSRIAVPRESVFLLPLSEVLKEEAAWQGWAGLGFEAEHVFNKLREFSDYFFDAYAMARGKPRWADKSPQYVDCLDFIEKLYGPACKYLFIYRHGLDVANSIAPRQNIKLARPHKEACGDPYVGAARYWAVQCQKMLAFASVRRERVLGFKYEDFVQSPEQVGRQICSFLNESWEPHVLEFYKHEHDIGGLEDPIASASNSFQPSMKNYLKLPTATLEAMKREAGEMLERLGYQD
ncbi:MAG: sulfotransferase family protein [bacterium]